MDKEGDTYIVPMDCPSTRFRRPAGMRSILYCNTVVMKYHNKEQYLVTAKKRSTRDVETAFLCCASSSASAFSKGLIRHIASGTVYRSYKAGTKECLQELLELLDQESCVCKESKHRVSFGGVRVKMCDDCWER